jgi:hypothetical protein
MSCWRFVIREGFCDGVKLHTRKTAVAPTKVSF